MTNPIKSQPGIADIDPYVGGDSHVAGATSVIKLSSNENPLGPSQLARAAYREADVALERYPSSDHSALRGAIAEVHGLDAARVICGAGSDEIIAFLCQAYAGQGDEVVHTEHGFSMYRISALAVGATPVIARENNRVTDVDSLLAVCSARTKIVFIANPNNPTGTMISNAEVARLAAGIPAQTLLVLDGAYAEYVDGFDGGSALVETRQNVVMTRTFSKIYGLGGLRVGWGYGPAHVIDTLNRIRGPFNLSTPALAAATAGVRDQSYVTHCRGENSKWRDWLIAALSDNAVTCAKAHGNFVLAEFPTQREAEACDDFLKARGIIVRRVAGYNLPDCLRITVGDGDQCRAVAVAVAAFKRSIP